MDKVEIQNIMRAIIQASTKPVLFEEFCLAFADCKEVETINIQEALEALLKREDAVQELKAIAGGYRYHIKQQYIPWIHKIQDPESSSEPLSSILLETLGIIAYRQPVSRGEIDLIRGKQTSVMVIQQLEERQWIKVVAYGGESKRAALYGTTKGFLEYFGLNGIEDLPDLEEKTIIQEISL